MNKVRNLKEINEKLILGWKTPSVEKLLKSVQSEQELISAYENGLFDTPAQPKVSPREMIYILTTQKGLSPEFIKEIKNMTRQWRDKTAATWNENVPPFYSVEIEYILGAF